MRFEMILVFSVLVVLTGSSQTRGQSSALPPVFTPVSLLNHAGNSASPDLSEDPGNEVPAGRDETSTQTTAITTTAEMVHSEAATHAVYNPHMFSTSSAEATFKQRNVPDAMTAYPGTPSPSTLPSHPLSAAADGLSSTPTIQSTTPLQHLSTAEGRAPLTRDPLTTVSSQPAHTLHDRYSQTHITTIQPQSESPTTATAQPTTTGHPLTSAPGRGPSGSTNQEVPSELNVGDEDLKGPRYHSSSPLDPLLAGLLSVFIVTTAIVFIILFLKFRQRTNHPEFHRLQDLPMDDLMEDTPLSRYSR